MLTYTDTASASFEASFDFNSVAISVNVDITEIGLKSLASQILAAIHDQVQHILSDADSWLSWVKQGFLSLEQSAESIAKLLRDEFKLAKDDVKDKLTKFGKFSEDEIDKALKKLF